MEPMMLTYKDIVDIIFSSIDNVKISKTDEEWDSLSIDEQFNELRYMITIDKKKMVTYFMLEKIFMILKYSTILFLILGFSFLYFIISFIILHVIEKQFKKRCTIQTIKYNSSVDVLEKMLNSHYEKTRFSTGY